MSHVSTIWLLSQALQEQPKAECSSQSCGIPNAVSHLCLQVFQLEDERELEERFSDKHRKTELKPQKKEKSRVTFDDKCSHYSFVLLIKILSISATKKCPNPSLFQSLFSKGKAKKEA